MTWHPKKSIEIRRWDLERRLRHSRIGRSVSLIACQALAMSMLSQAAALADLTDDELRREARATLTVGKRPPGELTAFPHIIEGSGARHR